MLQDGMSWSNYGKEGWVIDHIRPISSFDLLDPVEQRLAFNFKNTQPMWYTENAIKGDKWEPS